MLSHLLPRLAIVGGTNVMALMVRETALAAHTSVLLTQSAFFEYLPFWPLLVLVIFFLLRLGAALEVQRVKTLRSFDLNMPESGLKKLLSKSLTSAPGLCQKVTEIVSLPVTNVSHVLLTFPDLELRPFGTFCGHSLTAVLVLPLLVPLGVKLEEAAMGAPRILLAGRICCCAALCCSGFSLCKFV